MISIKFDITDRTETFTGYIEFNKVAVVPRYSCRTVP
eukprot:SAG31_NODE_2394_length_5793_cov_2.006674_4_plen_37_part_00